MENHISGSWTLDKYEVKPFVSLLKEFSILEVKGEDAEVFLHGQFTNHIKNLGESFRLAAYCQPQGRILALMRVVKYNDTYLLILPTDLVAGFVKRLSMFILRSKVTIREAQELSVYGLIDPDIAPPEIDHAVLTDGYLICRVSDWNNKARVMVVGDAQTLSERFTGVTDDAALWFKSEIESGTPWVFEKTKEAFIPQWINLDKIGGLVFDKGCYPGQEIISRVQHIGSTPCRMIVLKSNDSVTVLANTDIFQANQAVGNIVMSVNSSAETVVLAEVSLKSMEGGTYQINGVSFSMSTLPYSI